jgi:hypothetical protein
MSRKRLLRVAAVMVWAAGCSGSDLPDEGPTPILSGPILSFDMGATVMLNMANLPQGFTGPQETVCAVDTTRGFLSELATHGITDTQVAYEWAPMIGGPTAAQPTVGQPEFYMAGTIKALERSGLDFRPPHPFGFDTTWDMVADQPYLWLIKNRPGDPNDDDAIHAEVESGLFPDIPFGFTPTQGDRVLMKGAWIFDCGHPEYEAEMHPPTFVALARSDGTTTTSLAFAQPYRNTQLYGSADLVDAFDSMTRYQDPEVAPFDSALRSEVLRGAVGIVDHFELHTYVEATHFDPITWFVCAPDPAPPGATLAWSYRFVTRTGVNITAATRGDSACLAFHAEMTGDYAPADPGRMDYPWPWSQISSEASSQIGSTIDVRQMIVDALTSMGFTNDVHALHPDVSPIIDVYPALAPRDGADADSPTEIVQGADDQPFPFYGRVRVYWQ